MIQSLNLTEIIVAFLGLSGVIITTSRKNRGHLDDKLSALEQKNHEEHMNSLGRIFEVKEAIQAVDSKIEGHIAYHRGQESV